MKFMVSFSICIVALSLIFAVLPINGEGKVYENTLRLHVVANSDEPADQELKLEVRDGVIEEMARWFDECNTKYEAEMIAERQREEIAAAASKVIAAKGYDYPVEVEIGQEYYPTREYEGVRLPAGVYSSVRVKIGEAKGKNWWCVLFPPLCVNAASPKRELAAAGFTPSQIRVLTDDESPRYVLKFRLLEMLGAIFGGDTAGVEPPAGYIADGTANGGSASGATTTGGTTVFS